MKANLFIKQTLDMLLFFVIIFLKYSSDSNR